MTLTFKNTPTKTVDVDGISFAYRELGQQGGIPLILLHHLTAVLDDWDPRIVDALAVKHHVIAFDNRGVGASGGITPDNIVDMAQDAIGFIDALGLTKVDLLGFSLGGFISQAIVEARPELVRKIVLAGTGPAGGEGIANIGAVLQQSFADAGAAGKHPKNFLFFTQTPEGQKAADIFLERLNDRKEDRDTPVSNATIQAQVTAITKWGLAPAQNLGTIPHPVFVANGDNDIMVPTINSLDLARRLPNNQLSIFPNSGHGGIFQYHDAFVAQTLSFLQD